MEDSKEELFTGEEETRDSRKTLNRDESRSSRKSDKRVRDDWYDIPDLDQYDEIPLDVDHLCAPPAQIHPTAGLMQQVWVNVNLDNGSRVEVMKRKGYVLVDPRDVPNNFKGMTRLWENRGCIMVNNELVLMHIPKKIYDQRKAKDLQKPRDRIAQIKQEHGTMYRDGTPSGKDASFGDFVGGAMDTRGFARVSHFA